MNPIMAFSYIVKDLMASKGDHQGLQLAFTCLEVVRSGDKARSRELPKNHMDVLKTMRDLLETLWEIKARGTLDAAGKVLIDSSDELTEPPAPRSLRASSTPSSIMDSGEADAEVDAGIDADFAADEVAADEVAAEADAEVAAEVEADVADEEDYAAGPSSDRSGAPERSSGKRTHAALRYDSDRGDDLAADDESEATATDADDDDEYIESDGEGTEEDIEPAEELTGAFVGTYFNEVHWDEADAREAFTLNSPDWREWVPVVSKMGELLEAPKTLEALMVLRISCRLMEDDFEAQDLVNPDLPVFNEFWKRGRAVCTCIMQGGKTRRCILLRGYVHAGVHNKHAVVLANGMAPAYADMNSAMQDLNEDYRAKVLSENVRLRNDFLPNREIYLFTQLNQKSGLEAMRQRHPSTVHFNVRLSNMAALNSLATPFRNMLAGGFTSQNTHLILDESHEALGKRKFAVCVREYLSEWEDLTLVTATPIAQFVVPECLGDTFSLVEVVPRPGYYLYGPNSDHPEKDSEDGKVLVVKYTRTDTSEDADTTTEPEESFPYSSFQNSRQSPKRLRVDEGASCTVPEGNIAHLDKLAQLRHSYFCIVLNDILANVPNSSGKASVNVGHALFAKWVMQNTTKLQERQRRRGRKSASVVAYTVYSHSRVSSEFARPRLFFNRVFLIALANHRSKDNLGVLLGKIFTIEPKESNSRVLLKKNGLETIKDYFAKVFKYANEMYTGTLDERDELLRYEGDTFSLELPRLAIKAVLSLVRHLHESRFKEQHSYETMPLKLTVVGGTLLKQSVNVESKCRELQSTHLMYIRKEHSKVDLVRLLQKLGRVDHGHTDSAFYRSAFPDAETVAHRRPTVLMSQALIRIVLRSPARQKDAAAHGDAILPGFHHDMAKVSPLRCAIQANVPPLNQKEKETFFSGLFAAPVTQEGTDRRSTDCGLLSRVKYEIDGWTKAREYSPTTLKRMTQMLYAQIHEGSLNARPSLADLREIFTLNDDDSTPVQQAVHRFLSEIDELPIFD